MKKTFLLSLLSMTLFFLKIEAGQTLSEEAARILVQMNNPYCLNALNGASDEVIQEIGTFLHGEHFKLDVFNRLPAERKENELLIPDKNIKDFQVNGPKVFWCDGRKYSYYWDEDKHAVWFTEHRSPLYFKVSCAATATGLAAYCAIWFYNKDKAKERQLSKLKWSLGAAIVVGLGTYWYVQ